MKILPLLVIICLVASGCVRSTTAYVPAYNATRVVHQPINQSESAPTQAVAPEARPIMRGEPAKNSEAQEVRVGILLPLSGEHAALGQAMLNAAQMGLFDKYASIPAGTQKAKLVLIPKDTAGTPEGASGAAKAALANKVKFLIGPIFSAEVAAASKVASEHHVRLLAFSNNPQVAGNGTYLFGFSPEAQVKRILAEAYARGVGRVAVLVPDNDYGRLVASTARELTVLGNKTLVGVQLYMPSGADADSKIDALFEGIDMKNAPKVDALLLAEGPPNLVPLLVRLYQHHVSTQNVVMLGTGLWDDPTLIGNPAIQGGLFASSPPSLTQQFENRYRQQYNALPPRLASLAYDAVTLAATIAESGDFDFLDSSLASPGGFIGPANGLFRFNENGMIERSLAVVAIGNRSFQEVAPAPASF